MSNIEDIIKEVERLRRETMVGAIDPERLGKILCDTLACLREVAGEMIPAFDLLTSRTRRNVTEKGEDYLLDYFPTVRLKGETMPSECMVEIYRYQNRGNKKYKKVLSAYLHECEAPEKWAGGGYRSVVLPWSLQRILWESWDPTAAAFHDLPYDSQTVASKWIEVHLSDRQVKNYKDYSCLSRKKGPMFSARFGIRMVNPTSGAGGEMKIFRISIQETYFLSNTNALGFSMKVCP